MDHGSVTCRPSRKLWQNNRHDDGPTNQQTDIRFHREVTILNYIAFLFAHIARWLNLDFDTKTLSETSYSPFKKFYHFWFRMHNLHRDNLVSYHLFIYKNYLSLSLLLSLLLSLELTYFISSFLIVVIFIIIINGSVTLPRPLISFGQYTILYHNICLSMCM